MFSIEVERIEFFQFCFCYCLFENSFMLFSRYIYIYFCSIFISKIESDELSIMEMPYTYTYSMYKFLTIILPSMEKKVLVIMYILGITV